MRASGVSQGLDGDFAGSSIDDAEIACHDFLLHYLGRLRESMARPVISPASCDGSGRQKERSSRAPRNTCRLYAAFFTLPCGSMTNFFGEPSLNVLYASGACSSVMISVFSMAPR